MMASLVCNYFCSIQIPGPVDLYYFATVETNEINIFNRGNHNQCVLVSFLLFRLFLRLVFRLVAPATRLGAGEAAVLPLAAGPAAGARRGAAGAEPSYTD